MQTNRVGELTNKLKDLALETNRVIGADQEISAELEGTESPDEPRQSTPTTPTDRTGTPLKVGSRVRLLTTGLFIGTTGVITKIGKSRATIRLDGTKRKTNRVFRNLKVEQNERN